MQPAHSKFAVTPRPQAKPRVSTVATVGHLARGAGQQERVPTRTRSASERIWSPTV